MAKVTGPLFSTEARGRMSALVYNTWRGIATVKSKIAPSQPRTAAQLAVRALTIAYSRLWQTIAAASQTDWRTYAADHPETDWTGSPRRLTGENWFVRLSVRMKFHNLTPPTTPPAAASPAIIAAFAASSASGQSVLSWTSPGGTGVSVEIYHHGPHSAGCVPVFNKARYMFYLPAETATYTKTGLAAGVHSFWIRAFDEATGQVSLFTQASCVTT